MGPDRTGTRRAGWLAIVLAAGCTAAPLLAQGVVPGPPGPYVVDVRGTTMGVPQSAAFYPPAPADTLVATRGFGIEVGGHVYLQQVGPARLGAGASVQYVRGTSGVETSIGVWTFAPQVSFNFGTGNGWSYLSGGAGAAHVTGRHTPVGGGEAGRGRGVLAVNVGGGARWFFRPRVALTFDVRLHRLGAGAAEGELPGAPAAFLGAASLGLSFK